MEKENGVPEDPVNTLGYLKTFFLPGFQKSVRHWNWMKKKRTKWQEVAENLAPYPKGTIREIQDNPTLWKEVDVSWRIASQEMLDKENLL